MPIEVFAPSKRSFSSQNGGRHLVHVVDNTGRIKTIQWAASVGQPWLVAEQSERPDHVYLKLRVTKEREGAKLLKDHYEESGHPMEDYELYLEWDRKARAGMVGQPTDTMSEGAHPELGTLAMFPEDRLPKTVLALRRGHRTANIFRVPPREEVSDAGRSRSSAKA